MKAEFKKERDVRQWIKKTIGDRVFWIEHGVGGTVGMTDVVAITRMGEAIFLELKLGEYKNNKRYISYKLRPLQKVLLKKLSALGAATAVIVGVKNTSKIAILGPSKGGLAGTVDIKKTIKKKRLLEVDYRDKEWLEICLATRIVGEGVWPEEDAVVCKTLKRQERRIQRGIKGEQTTKKKGKSIH